MLIPVNLHFSFPSHLSLAGAATLPAKISSQAEYCTAETYLVIMGGCLSSQRDLTYSTYSRYTLDSDSETLSVKHSLSFTDSSFSYSNISYSNR